MGLRVCSWPETRINEMKERERAIVTALTIVMLVLWLGFVFHQSPRFAGSFWGGVLGVAGGVLMLVPLAYMFVKRIKWLKTRTKKYVSMRTLLAWHVYAGIIGPILVLLHTGHKFESPLGIALTAMTLIVVVSGFIGRYLMNQFSTEIREKKRLLAMLEASYERAGTDLRNNPESAQLLRPFSSMFGRLVAGFFIHDTITAVTSPTVPHPATLIRLSESIADVEYAIKTHEHFKQWFGKWLKLHIVISVVLYVLMGLHIWAAIHFGLRWFEPSSTTHFAAVMPVRVVTTTTTSEGSSTREVANPTAEFSQHFGKLFRNYWRGTATIHGYRTTVFDYAGISSEVHQPDSDLQRSLAALQRVRPNTLVDRNQEKSFWINVYNLAAMKLAAENYPLPSIVDTKIDARDPWSVPAIEVGGDSYSLKQIENEILLRKFKDPRIVFAISCAAVSCPDRSSDIFRGDRVELQLDTIVRELLGNETKGMRIDRNRKRITLSWIFKADKRLFGDDSGLLDFVQGYTSTDDSNWIDEQRNHIVLDYFQHDWTLNDLALADKRE